jgi:ABC-2 type transport system ATP-binding protein
LFAVETKGLRKEFSGEIEAVAGIDLDVNEGEVFGFLGPNGAGKTTTVRMLTTLLAPSSGVASVMGFDLYKDKHAIRRSIGVALQEAGLDPLSTGRELLVLQGQLNGLTSGEAKRRSGDLLGIVGLEDAADRQVKTYSGGMKRRLDLASALIHEPRMLFLDEPTEGLDPASRASVWGEVQRLNQQGMTVFLTTHYLEEADRLANRLAIIDHGHIVAQGTPASLKAGIGSDVVTVTFHSDRVEAGRAALAGMDGVAETRNDGNGLTMFVSDGSQAVAQVIRVLDGAGIEMVSVSVSNPSLDEVFLKATGSRLEGAQETSGENQSDGN